MLEQKTTELGAGTQAFLAFEQEGFHVRALRMGPPARTRGVECGLGEHAPIEEGKEGTVALHEGIMLKHMGHGLLVKDTRKWYHSCKLLAGQVGEHFFLLCLQVSLLSRLNTLYTACLIGISSDPLPFGIETPANTVAS